MLILHFEFRRELVGSSPVSENGHESGCRLIMHRPMGITAANNASASVTGGWFGRCTVIWVTNKLGDRLLGNKLNGGQLGDTRLS